MADPMAQQHELFHLGLTGGDYLVEFVALAQEFQTRRRFLIAEGDGGDANVLRWPLYGQGRRRHFGRDGFEKDAEVSGEDRRLLRVIGDQVDLELCPAVLR